VRGERVGFFALKPNLPQSCFRTGEPPPLPGLQTLGWRWEARERQGDKVACMGSLPAPRPGKGCATWSAEFPTDEISFLTSTTCCPTCPATAHGQLGATVQLEPGTRLNCP
jgi:hypothetical protein